MMKKSLFPVLLAVLVVCVFASSASAARKPANTCTISAIDAFGDVTVSATGLPTDKVISFYRYNDTRGDWIGFPLGYEPTGSASVYVYVGTEDWHFQFTDSSRVVGPTERVLSKDVVSECVLP
jgi:hypothetical protein